MTSPSKAHTRTPSTMTSTDGDNPQSMVIASLRSQVNDLVSQVTQLNSKLVQSYDRISDLEDNIHLTSSNLRTSTVKISQLELERTQHLSALNTGLLVEKSHVTAELTRLMERATEESSRRGMAESARQEIEKDLDDLSAELFDRANTMVAEARLAQTKSERRVQDTKAALKSAEDAVASMQSQLQSLQEEKGRNSREINDMRELMGKGKWVERERWGSASLRLLSTHAPYQEFLLFVAHLRQIRPGTTQPPPMATLLPLPFLTRFVSEDSDPTLRLDTAPSLNWLTRRAVSAAIYQSQLTIESVSANTLLEMQATQAPVGSAAAIAAFSSQIVPTLPTPAVNAAVIPCALCGTPVLPSHASGNIIPAQPSTSWRPAFFSRSTSSSSSVSSHPHIHSPTPSIATSGSFYPPSASSRLSPPPTPPPHSQSQAQAYVFRIPATGGSGPSPFYSVCGSGWCLARLRTTCEAWRFVRRGIIEKVWAEEVPGVLLEHPPVGNGTKPPVPPRRRMNVGKLIGMALGKGSGKDAIPNGKVTAEEKFSPPPQMSRRLSEEQRLRGATGTAPAAPPLSRRNETRAKADDQGRDLETQKDREEGGSQAHIEGVTLFDVDGVKQNESQSNLGSIPDPGRKDDPPIVPAANPVDPTQIPLPTSPKLPPEHGHLTETHSQRTTDVQHHADPDTNENRTQLNEAQQSIEVPPSTGEMSKDPPASKQPPPALTVSPTPPHTQPALSPVPSRTSSPAPPPVPRRAPRRAAPIPPGGGGASSKPAADTALHGDASKADESPAPITISSISSDRPPTQGLAADGALQNGDALKPNGSSTPTASTSTTHDQPTDQSTAAEASQSGGMPGGDASLTPTTAKAPSLVPPSAQDPPDVASQNASQASGSSITAVDSSTSIDSSPMHSSSDLKSHAISRQDVSQKRQSRDVSPNRVPEEQEAYIGTATWEERTWKELVKLREDMFYARVGTAR